MQRHVITGTAVAADADGLANDVTGATWALTASSAGDSLAHKITVKGNQATDHSAKTGVIVGTDADGRAQTETINLPNGTATVTTAGYYLTVTSVTPSATITTDTMDIGWAVDAVSPTLVTSRTAGANIGFGCTVSSATYTVQQTYDGSAWFAHSSVATETTNQDGSYTAPVYGIRLLWTAAGTVTLTAWQG